MNEFTQALILTAIDNRERDLEEVERYLQTDRDRVSKNETYAENLREEIRILKEDLN